MTDLEEIPQDPHECCWHFVATSSSYTYWQTGTHMTRREVCCHCGNQRTKQPELPPIPEGHGKFYPRLQGTGFPLTIGGGSWTPGNSGCPCNPANGGSGICHCILGSGTITL